MLVFFSIHIVVQLVRSGQERGGSATVFRISFAIGLPLNLLLEVGHAEEKHTHGRQKGMLPDFDESLADA
jgi:hypothetical protein